MRKFFIGIASFILAIFAYLCFSTTEIALAKSNEIALYYTPAKNIKPIANSANPQVINVGMFQDARKTKTVAKVTGTGAFNMASAWTVESTNDAGLVVKEAFEDIIKRVGFILQKQSAPDNPPDATLSGKVKSMQVKQKTKGLIMTKWFYASEIRLEIICTDKNGSNSTFDIVGSFEKEGGLGDEQILASLNEALKDGIIKFLGDNRFISVISR